MQALILNREDFSMKPNFTPVVFLLGAVCSCSCLLAAIFWKESWISCSPAGAPYPPGQDCTRYTECMSRLSLEAIGLNPEGKPAKALYYSTCQALQLNAYLNEDVGRVILSLIVVDIEFWKLSTNILADIKTDLDILIAAAAILGFSAMCLTISIFEKTGTLAGGSALIMLIGDALAAWACISYQQRVSGALSALKQSKPSIYSDYTVEFDRALTMCMLVVAGVLILSIVLLSVSFCCMGGRRACWCCNAEPDATIVQPATVELQAPMYLGPAPVSTVREGKPYKRAALSEAAADSTSYGEPTNNFLP